MLNIIADNFALSVESENNEFFREIATGFTASFDKLLDSGFFHCGSSLRSLSQ